MLTVAFGVLGAFAVALLIGRPAISTLTRMKVGQKILEDGPTWHKSKQNTPTMGGLIFIMAMLIPVGACLPALSKADDYRPMYMVLLSLVFAAVGFIDDYTKIKKKQNKGLTAGQKLLLQIAAGALFISVLRSMGYIAPVLLIPFVNIRITLPWAVYLLFAVFVIVGTVNAVNLTDGIDGLCGSVTAVVAAFFCGVYYLIGSYSVIFPAALLGGLLGFLVFNRYPAKVFMGDTGALFLGGAVCAMAFSCNMPIILVPVGIIYIIETLSDIIQVAYFKISHGKRVFKMAPYHHHLEMNGWSENKIVAAFTAITAVTCLVSFIWLKSL